MQTAAPDEQTKVTIELLEQTIAQAAVVERLAKDLKDTSDTGALKQFEIEVEKLAHLQNAAKGPHRKRALTSLAIARNSVTGRAVTRPLPKI